MLETRLLIPDQCRRDRAAAPREDARGGPGAGVLHKCLLVKRSEQQAALAFRALGEPSRLRLMNLLFDGAQSVSELVEGSGLSLANVSKHLGMLHQVGWVTRTKVGVHVLYALADERTFGLCDLMCARVRELAHAASAATAQEGPPRQKRG